MSSYAYNTVRGIFFSVERLAWLVLKIIVEVSVGTGVAVGISTGYKSVLPVPDILTQFPKYGGTMSVIILGLMIFKGFCWSVSKSRFLPDE